jgi:aryl-alcohol dehydrogenase-like predicted oxidoreductase
MEQRSFGRGVHVSALGVGCARVGSISNPVSTREVSATLEAAIDAGVNLFDTADVYGQGDSERLLGRLRARYGDRMFVVTKVGLVCGRLANALRFAKPALRALVRARARTGDTVRGQMMRCDFTASYLRQAVEGSLRRLRTSALDGLLLHNPTPEALANPEIHELLHAFVQEGKAVNVGISANSVQDVEAALSIPAITMLQVPAIVAEGLTAASLSERLHQRGIALFVREILRRPDLGKDSSSSPREKLASALRHRSVTAAIVGVSTRSHLKELMPVTP